MKKTLSAILLTVVLLCGCSADLQSVFGIYSLPADPNASSCCQEYIPGTGNIKGDVDIDAFLEWSSDFDIGANADGKAVFKNPDKAFRTMKKVCAKGIRLIKRENHILFGLTKSNFRTYKNLGWQVTGGSEEARRQAQFVSMFLGIYENGCN